MFRKAHPDQIVFDWSEGAQMEHIIATRVAIRAEAEAIRWRFRLICMETVIMTALVVGASIALDQLASRVLHAAIGVALACLVSGLLPNAEHAAPVRAYPLCLLQRQLHRGRRRALGL